MVVTYCFIDLQEKHSDVKIVVECQTQAERKERLRIRESLGIWLHKERMNLARFAPSNERMNDRKCL